MKNGLEEPPSQVRIFGHCQSTCTYNQVIYCTYVGNFDPWGAWSACSITCGDGGTRTRSRTCPGPYECLGSSTETGTCTNNPACTSK